MPHDDPSALDALLDAFDAAWQSATPPGLENFLPPREEAGYTDALHGLVRIDLERRLKRGEAICLEHYLERFPELRLQGERLAEYLGRSPELADRLMEHLSTVLPADGSASLAPVPNRGSEFDLRHYVLLELVGKGGMGEVFRGRDPALDRNLAVKVLRREYRGLPEYEQRFEREARINGVLQHPSIVPVHNLGRLPDGRLYFTMKLIRGRTLVDLLIEDEHPDRLAALLGIFEKVCQALAYAHSRRVIHRDLKPSNVMVGAFGEVQVMDWGLAKVLPPRGAAPTGESTLGALLRTPSSGAMADGQPTGVVGTPAYLAPEQARGEEADERADVFGLGAILCTILTGQPPHTGRTTEEMMRQAAAGDLTAAFARLDGCGGEAELVALCRDCLAPRREDRPEDATAVAARVTSYLAAVQERLRQAEMERAAAAAREEEAKATAAATARAEEAKATAAAERRSRRLAFGLAAALVVGIGVSLYFLSIAKKAHKDSENYRRQAEWLAYAGQIAGAQSAWHDGDLVLASSLLDDCKEGFRGWEHRYVATLVNRTRRVFRGPAGSYANGVAFSPDGRRLAGAFNRTVKVWDKATGQEVFVFNSDNDDFTCVVFSPDGKRLAAATHPAGTVDNNFPGGEIKVWDTADWHLVFPLKGHSSYVQTVAFSPDGRRLVSGGGKYDQQKKDASGGEVKVWDAVTGESLRDLRGSHDHISSVYFSPDGQRVAAAETGAWEVKVWEVATGKEVGSFPYGAMVAVYSPDGKRLAIADWNQTVHVCEVATGRELFNFPAHSSTIRSVCFSPDGKRLATASDDRTVTEWDVANRQEIRTLKGHTGAVRGVCFSPDGKSLASASADGTVIAWSEAKVEDALSFRASSSDCYLGFSPDGQRLAISGFMGVAMWETATGQPVRAFQPSDAGILSTATCVCFSPDGKRLASARGNKTVRVLDAATGQEILPLNGHTGRVELVAFSPDGQRLFSSSSEDQTVKVWDAMNGQEVLSLKTSSLSRFGISPDGQRLVIGGGDIKVLEAATGREVLRFGGGADLGRQMGYTCWCFSPDGTRLAVGPTVWDATSGQKLFSLKGPHVGGITDVCFSPDGQRLASAGYDGRVAVWETATGQEVLSFKAGALPVRSVCFSPDGRRLASGGADGMVKVWETLSPE
jgi:WD40 repeat protein